MMNDHFSWRIHRHGGRRVPVPHRLAVEHLEDRNLLSFIAPVNYPSTGGPVAAGDFTGHGHLDLALVTFGGSVRILPGNGDGTFQSELPPVAVGPHIVGVAAADLRHNGILDLVVTHDDETNSPGNTVSVLLGNGDGTFQPPVDYQAGNNPHGVAVGDFTGSGIPDIVVTNIGFFSHDQFQPGTTVTVLLGNGDGTFQAPRTFDTGAIPEGVAVGDFTGDGRLSIVTANEGFAGAPSPVSFLRGNGDGTFQPPVSLGLGVPGEARSVAVADLNGDHHLDIVVASDTADGGTVSVLSGHGDGTFQDPIVAPVSNDPGFLPNRLALGDFSGDGHLDVAVTGGGGSLPPVGLYLLPGNGDGSFQAPRAYSVQSSPPVVGDFNGDGIDDLAVESGSAFSSDSVAILLGQPGRFLTFPSAFQAGAGATSVQSADLEGDGFADLVTANAQDNTVSVLLANGDGTFQPQVAYTVGRDPESVVVADLTGRGIPDLVVLNTGDRSVTVLRGQGDGTFQTAQTLSLSIDSGFVPVRLALGDFTGDGTPALAVLQRSTQSGRAGVLVLRGHGDGTFFQDPNLPDESLSLGINDPFGNYYFQAADLRHDGTLDLVYGGGGNSVFVALGNGDGTFQQPQSLRFQDIPTSVAVGDLNGDGIPDLVVTTRTATFVGPANSVFVLLGNGDGTFQAPVGYAVPGPSWAAAIGRFHGDGIPDIVVENGTQVRVLRGNGDGTFEAPTSYLVGVVAGLSGSLVAGDFNGDGAPDLAMANSFDGKVTVVLNRNDGLAPGGRYAPRPPHPKGGKAPLEQPEETLVQVVAQTPPATLRLDTATATSAPAGGQEAAADAYFAALTGEEHDAVVPLRRTENRTALHASRPLGYQDEDLAALAAELLTAPTEA
jgi:hypothetical protein